MADRPGSNPVSFHEIQSARDPAWRTWFDIYVESFPEPERMSEEYFLQVFAEKVNGGAADKQALAILDAESGEPSGMAYYEAIPDVATAYLWYVAIREERRGSGLGSAAYQALCSRLASEGIELLVFEVEIPRLAEGPEDERLAIRRIEWYTRLGARLMDDIEYFQSVDTGEPPTQMYLMTHAFRPLDDPTIRRRLKLIFQDAIRSEIN